MSRRGLALMLLAAAASPAADKWDKKVEASAQAVKMHAARAPSGVALPVYLRTAELLRATQPRLAWGFAMAAAEAVKTRKDPGYEVTRVVLGLMAIDPVEGEKIAWTLPGPQWVSRGVAGYWMDKEEYGRVAELARKAWREGAPFGNGPRLLSKLRESDPEKAAALYRDMVAMLPADKPSLETIRALMTATADVAEQDPAAAKPGFEKLLEVLGPEKFEADAREVTFSWFELGGKTVRSASTRESLLIPVGIAVHSLYPELYAKHRALFASWDGEIAAVKKDDLAKAARPSRTMVMLRTALEKNKGVPPEPPSKTEEKKPTFEEAFAKVKAEPEEERPRGFMRLLDREDLTHAQELQAAREVLALLPGTPLERGRAGLASELFGLAASKDWKDVVRSSADALAAALRDLENCRAEKCAAIRNGSEASSAYQSLAAGLRQANLRIPFQDPALQAHRAILDLKDLLDQKFDFDLPGIQGNRYRLTAQRGRIVMLNFWASW